jgi:hypothetical protein
MFDAAIYPVSDLRTNFREIENELAAKKVVYLTKNGRKKMLLLDSERIDDVLAEWKVRQQLDAIEADPRSKVISDWDGGKTVVNKL